MFEFQGLDRLTQDLDDAQKALAAIDGELGSVEFDPYDPASIDEAVRRVGALIDERLGEYASNPIVGPLVEEMKEQYREAIMEKAAAARLRSEDDD